MTRSRSYSRQQRQEDEVGDPAGPEPEPAGKGEQHQPHRAGHPGGDPAQLLPLDPSGGPEAEHHADRRRRQAQPVQHDADDRERAGDLAHRAGEPERVADPHLLQRSWAQGPAHHDQDQAGHAGGDDQPPAARAEVAVGQQQGRQRDPARSPAPSSGPRWPRRPGRPTAGAGGRGSTGRSAAAGEWCRPTRGRRRRTASRSGSRGAAGPAAARSWRTRARRRTRRRPPRPARRRSGAG
jgi:hypothetical protein